MGDEATREANLNARRARKRSAAVDRWAWTARSAETASRRRRSGKAPPTNRWAWNARAVALASLGQVCAGCGPAPDWGATGDPRLAALAADLLPGVERASGLRARGPLRVEAKSRRQLETFLVEKIAEETPFPQQALAPYALLGLMDPRTDLTDLLLSLHLEQVAGFYEPDSAALFVLADQPEELLEPLLVHEMVHALQDQHVDLDSLIAPGRGNDARAAAHAALEGHAMLATMRWSGARLDATTSAEALRAAILADADARHPLLAAAPAVVRESLLFPYVEGMLFARAAWARAEDRTAVLTTLLPRSTEQVARPGKLWSEPPDRPVRLTFRAPGVSSARTDAPAGAVRPPVRAPVEGGPTARAASAESSSAPPVREDGLGHMEIGALAETWGGARAAPNGWAGDAYALFGSPGDWSLRWVVAWDDWASREAFLDWVALAPRKPTGLAARRLDVEGLAAVEFVAGAPPEAEVRLAREEEP